MTDYQIVPGSKHEIVNPALHEAGQVADHYARQSIFADYLEGKSMNTERRLKADIQTFESFLLANGLPENEIWDMFYRPEAWGGVSWGLVTAFKKWMLQQGYAIGSINGKLCTVRIFADLAMKAGTMDAEQAWKIQTVKSYANKEHVHIDEKREAQGIQTRIGHKKAEPVIIPVDIAEAMTASEADTPQGKRDNLLMCLLLHHGLRVSEVAILTADNFDNDMLSFYRPKVNLHQTHQLSPATRKAWEAYKKYAPETGIIWRRSSKGQAELGGQLSKTSATRALTKRVELIGRNFGIQGLSAHDCRHHWATFESRSGTPIEKLKEAGGWASVAMPARYIADNKISNEGTARLK